MLERARQRLGEHGQGTILFLDEVHRFNKAQQDALLPGVESGLITLIGATTENPFFEVNPPLLSPLDAVPARAARPGRRPRAPRAGPRGRGRHGRRRRRSPTSPATPTATAATCSPASRWPSPSPGPGAGQPPVVTLADAEAALGTKALRYGRDEHYDVISAFIKSIRGSDPDAGLYWLARMLEAGEDARFIARRLVILASEDVGVADPQALRRGRRRRPRRRVRRACPRPSSTWPRPSCTWPPPRSRTGWPSASGAPGRTCATARRWRCRSTSATPTTRGARSSGTERATSILTTTPRAGCRRSTCPTRSPGAPTTSPPTTASSRRSARAWNARTDAGSTRVTPPSSLR